MTLSKVIVVRAATSLLIRWICSLALVVAAMPAKAGSASCPMPVSTAVSRNKAGCGMPCCEALPANKGMACDRQAGDPSARCEIDAKADASGHPKLAQANAGCKCEIRSAPSAPAAIEIAVVPDVHLHAVVAVLPTQLPAFPGVILIAEPGFCGTDAGPPASADRQSDRGRAPPVA